MAKKTLTRITGRTGPFWRFTVGEGRGSLTFFSRISAADCVGRYMAHCRRMRWELTMQDIERALAHG